MVRFLSYLMFIFFMSCSSDLKNNILVDIVNSMDSEFHDIVSNPKKYRLQILYTQINRNKRGRNNW